MNIFIRRTKHVQYLHDLIYDLHVYERFPNSTDKLDILNYQNMIGIVLIKESNKNWIGERVYFMQYVDESIEQINDTDFEKWFEKHRGSIVMFNLNLL